MGALLVSIVGEVRLVEEGCVNDGRRRCFIEDSSCWILVVPKEIGQPRVYLHMVKRHRRDATNDDRAKVTPSHARAT